MTVNTSPFSGYLIGKIYTTQQQIRPEKPSDNAAEHAEFRFGWDWRWLEHDRFEVRLTVGITASPERPEDISTDVIGQFRLAEQQRIAVEEFARLQAVAILLPYARQFLANLTFNGLFGAYHLPTLNVNVLMEGMDLASATAASQKRPVKAVEIGGDEAATKDIKSSHRGGSGLKKK